MGSGGGSWDTNDVLNAARLNQKTVFISVTEPTTTYSGQLWYDTSIDKLKSRNSINTAWSTVGTGDVVTDHGGLTGLTDDDHTQYLLADATRALTNNWNAGKGIGVLGAGTVDNASSGFFYSSSWNDDFLVGGSIYIGHYGLGWAAWSGDPEAWFSGYNGIRFFTVGTERLKIGPTSTSFNPSGDIYTGPIIPQTDLTYELGIDTTGTTVRWAGVAAFRVRTDHINPDINRDVYFFYNATNATNSNVANIGYKEANSGTTTFSSPLLRFNGSYYDGASQNQIYAYERLYVPTTVPTDASLLYNFNGSVAFQIFSNHIRVQSPSGYVDIGSYNSTWAHFYTDRDYFYFDKGLHVNGTIIPYVAGGTFDLGTSTEKWRNVYANTINSDIVVLDSDAYLRGEGTGTIRIHAPNNVLIDGPILAYNPLTLWSTGVATDTVLALNRSASTLANYITFQTGWGTNWTVLQPTGGTSELSIYSTELGAYLLTMHSTGTGTVSTRDLIPLAASTYNLGTSTSLWNNAYANTINATTRVVVGSTAGPLHVLPRRLETYDSSWTGVEWHQLLKTEWTAVDGDFLYLAAPGNSTQSTDAAILIGEGNASGFKYGLGSYTGTSLTTTYFRVGATGTIHAYNNIVPTTAHAYNLGASGSEFAGAFVSTVNANIVNLASGIYMTPSSSVAIAIFTPSGYGNIGAQDTTAFHFYTDRPEFYFGTIATFKNLIRPATDNTNDIGSTDKRWRDIHASSYRVQPVPVTNLASGITGTFQVGEIVQHGTPLVMKSDGKFYKAQGTATTLVPAMAMSVGSISANAIGTVLYTGYISNGGWAFTTGQIQFVSITAGTLTPTAPSSTGNQVQPIGVATASTILWFKPDFTIVEV